MIITCSIISAASIIGASYYKWKYQTNPSDENEPKNGNENFDRNGFEKLDNAQQELIIENQKKYKTTLEELKSKWNENDGFQLKHKPLDSKHKCSSSNSIHDFVKHKIEKKFKNHLENENSLQQQESEIEF